MIKANVKIKFILFSVSAESFERKLIILIRIHSGSSCYKTLFGGNLDFTKIKKGQNVLPMSERVQKCEKWYFEQS